MENTIEIHYTDRRRINDLVKFVQIQTEEFSTNAKQVLMIELLRAFKTEMEELKSKKNAPN